VGVFAPTVGLSGLTKGAFGNFGGSFTPLKEFLRKAFLGLLRKSSGEILGVPQKGCVFWALNPFF